MRDMQGDQINVGDKIVYEYHGRGQNGLQQAICLKSNPDSIVVGWTFKGDTRTADNFIGTKVTLRGGANVLRLP